MHRTVSEAYSEAPTTKGLLLIKVLEVCHCEARTVRIGKISSGAHCIKGNSLSDWC